MTIKIDLEKAYHRLSWSFIRDTLQSLDFPEKWTKNIMHYIQTPRLAVVWNGKCLDWFSPSRGIRQGDSISPYIFVLCMERVSSIIQAAVDAAKWKPIKLSRNGPALTHLFFSDDLILLAKASVDQLKEVMNFLETFCIMSGQKVSLQKSNICFSNNVSAEEAKELAKTVDIPLTKDLGRYLGTPSLHGRTNPMLFQQMLDRINSRLERWKTN